MFHRNYSFTCTTKRVISGLVKLNGRAYSRKAGDAWDKKGHFLVNLGQFKHETHQTTYKFKVFGLIKFPY